MENTLPVLMFLLVAIVAANLPWLSDRVLCVMAPPASGKSSWFRWLEWLVMCVLVGLMAAGLEYKLMGSRAPQDWEFYVVGLCLFLVFALPGFIYCVDLKKVLAGRQKT